MNADTWNAILRSLKTFDSAFADELAKSAAKAYAVGTVSAMKDLKVAWAAPRVMQDSQAYGKVYGELLRSEGASIIGGEKVPWAADRSTDQRDRIQQIIEDGIKSGKPTGIKERVGGGYPKGTIAADLNEYFDGRRSQASTVARTEVARIQTQSKVAAWERHGVEEVDVLDGTDDDDACRQANGSRWTLEYARAHELEHPNCRRVFTPVIRGFKKRSA